MTTRHGQFSLIEYHSCSEPGERLALVKGAPPLEQAVLVRLHGECLTGDVLGSLQCDCGQQLDLALKAIAEETLGILL